MYVSGMTGSVCVWDDWQCVCGMTGIVCVMTGSVYGMTGSVHVREVCTVWDDWQYVWEPVCISSHSPVSHEYH